MKNSIGTNVILTLFGESHGPVVGAVIDGLAAGIPVDNAFIASQLARRRPQGPTDTARQEKDQFQILSGVFNGYTTGAPLCIVIPNEDTRSSDYEATKALARPSHADYVAQVKYGGFQDYRGGGHFSGRVTAAIVAAGAIALKALETKGIHIGTHILECGGVRDADFNSLATPDSLALLDSYLKALGDKNFPVVEDLEEAITAKILEAKADCDSVGGIIQTAVTGLEAGLGEPWFDSLEGVLSKALFAIGGIKGVEFGSGFSFATMKGSQANDCFCVEEGRVLTRTNHNGGINGGISNGMPVVFNCAVKPTPSIAKEQDTVDMDTCKEASLNLKGRHDPAIIRRICIVVTSMVAIVLCDVLATSKGTDYLR
jgi:chorismate synthase